MRDAQQHETEEHFATASLLYVNQNKKNFSKIVSIFFQILNFNGFDENSKFKKITLKLFLKIFKHVFCNIFI